MHLAKNNVSIITEWTPIHVGGQWAGEQNNQEPKDTQTYLSLFVM